MTLLESMNTFLNKVQGYGTQIKIPQDRTLTKNVEMDWPI